MRYYAIPIVKIQVAQSSEERIAMWKNMAVSFFRNWFVNLETRVDAVEDFKGIGHSENGLDKQRNLLAKLLDKNQTHVHLRRSTTKTFRTVRNIRRCIGRL